MTTPTRFQCCLLKVGSPQHIVMWLSIFHFATSIGICEGVCICLVLALNIKNHVSYFEIHFNQYEWLSVTGSNPTRITRTGRTAIGHAARGGYADLLEIMLRACCPNGGDRAHRADTTAAAHADRANKNESKKIKTPDGMEALQWEEEIHSDTVVHDDEWSKLYM